MELSTSRIGDLPVLEIRGEIDHGNASKVSAAVDRLSTPEGRIVLLDLTEVAYMDSGGISVLLSLLRRLRGQGWLGVIGPNQNVRRLFEIVGLPLDESFRVFSDRAEADRALRQTPDSTVAQDVKS